MAPQDYDGGVGVGELPPQRSDPIPQPETNPDPGAGASARVPEGEHDTPLQETPHAPDLTVRLYVGLWLPAAGAFIAAAVLRESYWAAFIGVELLLVGWFTLAKL